MLAAMPSPEVVPSEARDVLELAKRDRAAAVRRLDALPLERQVELVCETPVARRAALLELLSSPEVVIPELPEAELCFTAKAVGLADAGWILEHASDAQMVACLDLDAWRELAPDRTTLDAWLVAFADAGPETLVRAAHALDPELVVLALKARIEVWLKPNDDDWVPPAGARTLEGQFWFRALRDDDDLEEIETLLRSLFECDYWLYFRLVQGVIWELEGETEEWALRWRAGRLEDLGFPPWDEAIRIYGYLRASKRAEIPPAGRVLDVDAWRLPIWLPRLPAGVDARFSIFRAFEKLPDEERRAAFYAFLALANKVAVADRLPLGDAESIPSAIEKAASVASRGLEFVSAENGLDATEVVRRVPLERLFRVGASLDRAERRPVASQP
jgi:hypothetical protein